MTRFTIPIKETVAPESGVLFNTLEKGMGFVPNLYAYMGHSPNARLKAIVTVAAEITRTQGIPSTDSLRAFTAQGFGEGALVDLVSLIGDKIIANYLHNSTGIAINFPVAPQLEDVAA